MSDKSNLLTAIADQMDRLIIQSRLQDMALIAQSDRRDRLVSMMTVISRLKTGAYLLGCGPYCCGVLPLSVDEVVLGRTASPLEASPDTVVDYALNDAVWMVPREVSRVHARILRRQDSENQVEYWLGDANSCNGTYVNGKKIEHDGSETDKPLSYRLEHGDAISLGPSGVNCYLFCEIN